MNILAFESSCDETAAAVVRDGRTVLSSVIASSADMHAIYGGVVPEIASRKHIEAIAGLSDQALVQAGVSRGNIDAVAVTYAPGLIGAVLVGVNFAKSAALALGRPLIPVHHLNHNGFTPLHRFLPKHTIHHHENQHCNRQNHYPGNPLPAALILHFIPPVPTDKSKRLLHTITSLPAPINLCTKKLLHNRRSKHDKNTPGALFKQTSLCIF